MNSNDRIILSAENLSTGYRNSRKETVIQRNLSFSLRRGELTSLIGLNGSGKSTLIKTLCGFLPPLEGEVKIAGKEISRYSAGEFARKVAVVLTDKTYSGAITVRELVSMGRYPHTGWLGKLSHRDNLIVDESMVSTGVYHKADSFPTFPTARDKEPSLPRPWPNRLLSLFWMSPQPSSMWQEEVRLCHSSIGRHLIWTFPYFSLFMI